MVRDEGARRSNIEYILLELRGDNNPMRYLNQIRQYWEAVQPLDNKPHYLLEHSLSAPAENLWQVVKVEVNSFQTFERKFLKRYWGEQAQCEIRRKPEKTHHARNATSVYVEAKELYPLPSDREVIQKLARHFNEEIKYAIIGAQVMPRNSLNHVVEFFLDLFESIRCDTSWFLRDRWSRCCVDEMLGRAFRFVISSGWTG